MKNILLALISIFILFTIGVFIFIPGTLVIHESRSVGTTSGGLDSCLHNMKKWRQWWPGQHSDSGNDSLFVYEGYTFKLSARYSDGGAIEIKSNNISLETRIQTITENRDSITVNWDIVLLSGNNPFTRFSRYLYAGKLRKSIKGVFNSLCQFAGKTENIYGFPVERTTFTEVILLAYRFKTDAYPTTEIIYNAVKKLRQYITSLGAEEKYYPMMNTRQVDISKYETMVAISIDKEIQPVGEFFISRMVPMKDRFLATEVTGGPAKIEQAHNAIEKYMRDHSLSAPAIPFEILVTDRNRETDSSTWKTRIFYPSM